jgi:hypothetical protein
MQSFLHAIRTIFGVYLDGLTFIRLCFSPRAIVAAENLFLRRQLGLYIERKVKPRRATDAIRFTLARLSRLFDWKTALTIVKPDTLIRWHRKGFRLLWKWKSQPRGRPRVPVLSKNSIVLGFEEDSAFRPRGSLPECKRVWIHLTFSSSLSPVG